MRLWMEMSFIEGDSLLREGELAFKRTPLGELSSAILPAGYLLAIRGGLEKLNSEAEGIELNT